MTLSEIFLSERPADAIVAIDSDGKSCRWKDFRTRVNSLASFLSARQEQRWALCFKDTYEFAIALFASSCAGKDITLPNNLASPHALIPLQTYFDALLSDTEFECESLTVNQKELDCQATNVEHSLNDISMTLFTSGSTSEAVPIQKNFSNLANEVVVLKSVFGHLLKDKEFFATVSHQHIYGLLFRVLLPLSSGNIFTSEALEFPDQISRASANGRVLVSSPAHLKRLEDVQVESGYAAIFSSGGPLPYESAVNCEEIFSSLPIEIYGSSETGGIGWRTRDTDETAWKTFPGVSVKVGEHDQLIVASPFIHADSPFETDDQVRLVTETEFQLLGRLDRVVKISEKRISLEQVEYYLKSLEDVAEARTLPIERLGRVEVCAVIVLTTAGETNLLNEGKNAYCRQIRKTLARFIEPVGVPRRFRFVDAIPVNSQGKYIHESLMELFV